MRTHVFVIRILYRLLLTDEYNLKTFIVNINIGQLLEIVLKLSQLNCIISTVF